ncbi:MAG: T9SS type A sorting domain-containing protein [Sphingobacteriaceae bacterium]|nr:T9SS type A sorting domain-containing protein [Sphingobacteriaceae bacterium]
MKRNSTIALLVIVNCVVSLFTLAQNPIYDNEKLVTINGFTIDAMEPHLHTNDSALFFNSLNDGVNTSLFFALRINDTTFNLVGAVPVVNQTVTPRLDAVASIDTMDNFYWVSTRGYPADFDNLHRIRFLQSGYTNFGRVHGDFYIYQPGYLIMDAAVNYYGDQLIYCNAYFNMSICGSIPCDASMGIAQKVNDSTFNKLPNTSTIMASINDTANFCVYAPNLTKDGLEFYYTRFLKTAFNTEIMVATRSNTNSAFGAPSILVGSPNVVPEAPTLTADKSKMYYHKKVGSTYKIFVRYRQLSTEIKENSLEDISLAHPNPANTVLNFKKEIFVTVYDLSGKIKFSGTTNEINVSEWANGIYFAKSGSSSFKFIVSH